MTQSKAEVRLAIKERLSRMSTKDREIESRVICRELKTLLGPTPHVLAAFMPYTDEPNIVPLIQEYLQHGWTIVMPAADNGTLVFRHVTDLSQMHRHPVTGIMEASEDCPTVDGDSIVDAIIPGRAFTASNDRMGRGNGGFDIWIATQKKAGAKTLYIGVCFECQVLQAVPMEPHDQKVDLVITSRGMLPPCPPTLPSKPVIQ